MAVTAGTYTYTPPTAASVSEYLRKSITEAEARIEESERAGEASYGHSRALGTLEASVIHAATELRLADRWQAYRRERIVEALEEAMRTVETDPEMALEEIERALDLVKEGKS